MIGVQAKLNEDFTDIPGVIIRKSYSRKGVREMLTESQEKMNEMAMKFSKQEEGFKNYTGRENYANGFVEEYYDTQICKSVFLIPGTSLLNKGLMGFVYLVWLLWLFVGIAIISDIFMESIEVITAQTTLKERFDREKQEYVEDEVKVWNETIANLTLMALGSSAPEILLNVLQAASTIAESPPELGPSTIVGSAAFNLLCISGVSIIAVGD